MRSLFKNVRVIDGLGGVIERGWLSVENDLIAAMGEGGRVPKDEEAGVAPDATFDLTGKTVLPGLIDCHVHLAMDGSPDPMGSIMKMSEPTLTLHMVRRGQLALRAGVTTLRDVGAKDFIDVHVRDAFASGLVKGPRILCAGQVICITGGHAWQMGCEADGPDGVRKAARKQIRAGVNLIKFMATGGVLTRGSRPGVPQLTREELKAGIEEAHKVSLKTAAHSQGLEGTRNAVFAGIDSIEHGVSLDEEIIDEMIKRDVFLVPTLSAPVNIMSRGEAAGIPEEFVEKTRRVREEHLKSLERARKGGVKIAMGTDAGTPFNIHGENAAELSYLVENGFSPVEAIVASTSRAAELLGIAGEVGTIAPKKQADLLIVDGNPLEDISILRDLNRIWGVYKGGKMVSGKIIDD